MVGRVLSNSIVRVKLWSADGRVLYSDDPAEIGGRYALSPDQLRLLREGGAEVEVSDLSRPENELDRRQGPDRGLLPDPHSVGDTGAVRDLPALRLGHRERPSPARGARAADPGRDRVDPPVQAPLLASLTRRLQRGHEEREALLANAVAASQRERQRVASYLHDGPVQDIAGLAFSLAPLADRRLREARAEDADELRTTSTAFAAPCGTCGRCSSTCIRRTWPRRGWRRR